MSSGKGGAMWLHAHVLAAADYLMEMCSLTARRSPKRLLSDFKS